MLFKKALVPYDESEHALSALHTAFALMGDNPEAEVHVVTAVSIPAMPDTAAAGFAMEDPFAVASEMDYDSVMGSIVHRVRADLDQVVTGAKDEALCKIVTNAIISSSPVEGIADYVDQNGIDVVIMGRRGLGALRGMLGSVSFGVLRSVDVPVLTVK